MHADSAASWPPEVQVPDMTSLVTAARMLSIHATDGAGTWRERLIKSYSLTRHVIALHRSSSPGIKIAVLINVFFYIKQYYKNVGPNRTL